MEIIKHCIIKAKVYFCCMGRESRRIVVVDDNEGVGQTLSLMLGQMSVEPIWISTPERLPEMMGESKPACVFLDMNFRRGMVSGNEGFYWLKWLRGNYAEVPVVLMTAYGDIDLAVRGIKEGATDFMVKPIERGRLMAVIDGLPKWSRRNISRDDKSDGGYFYGNSPGMNLVREMVERVAPTMASILVTGDNGTGKSALVRRIHELSKRKAGRLVHVDMGAIADTLFESELFGYAKGAFTGAVTGKAGLIEEADGGTLFLDEIANLTPRLQSKLLCVLQERCLTRLGETKPRKVDIRLVSATSADPERLVMEGLFRRDLLYRINTIHIDVPPLCRRGSDILQLAGKFLNKYSRIYCDGKRLVLSDSARSEILGYAWPGNVRELEHVMEKAVIMTDGDVVSAEVLGLRQIPINTENVGTTMADMERDMIAGRIEEHGGNMTLVAKSLGISRQTLYNKIKRYGL